MLTWKQVAAFALVIGLVSLVPAWAHEQSTPTAPTKALTLTTDDYIEIQQLVSRYGFALDTGADNGYQYADLFMPDGTFGRAKGRDQLAALARGGRRNEKFVRNFSGLAIITASPEGATGIQYAQAIDFWDDARGILLDHFGRYEDVYVKTPQGWRFKSRTFINESQSHQATQARPAR
jgi:hypothetical protein